MSDHVVYSCPCLNIKLHLANKHSLEGHEDQRKAVWTQLEDLPLEGWQFDLGMGGIVVFGRDIDRVKEDSSYSQTFGIKIVAVQERITTVIEGIQSFDLKILADHLISIENAVPGELYLQHKHICELLDQSLQQMQRESEVRIEEFRKSEARRLHGMSNHAKQERDALWAKMLEASKTMDKKRREQEMEAKKGKLDDAVLSNEHSAGRGALGSYNLRGSHVHFAEGKIDTKDDLTEDRRNAGLTLDSEQASTANFGNIATSLKRQSLILDENAIVSSLKDKSYTDENRQSIDSMGNEEQHGSDEESEDMFHLDEEISSDEAIEQPKDTTDEEGTGQHAENSTSRTSEAAMESIPGSHPSVSSWRSPSSSWLKKKRSTGKYIDAFDDEPVEHNNAKSSAEIEHGMSQSVSMYATSLPIAIHQPERNLTPEAEETKNAIRPSDRDPTDSTDNNKPSESRGSKIGSMNYDYSLVDREISQLFPQAERRRKSVAIGAMTGPQPQLFSLVGQSLDTRSSRIRKKDLSLSHREAIDHLRKSADISDDDEDIENGQMVPPHILAARAYTDETEELFGAVPRSQAWQRTID
ncbi:hypothetical protein EC973_000414 [Apophysomyces ossiformis]|uniref:Uncharacterized protein n=1 Tax=Apophysomyces ossiformis TaxID=679940 RepID=A0A8H7BL02_9FUNG|nr:hypothetical protein EC973_000414 [Apophysomyces ossiformis]